MDVSVFRYELQSLLTEATYNCNMTRMDLERVDYQDGKLFVWARSGRSAEDLSIFRLTVEKVSRE